MNDETRRFGFSPSPAHGRVPGPYTPLQDEPQDAGDICTAVGANMKTVPVPQIQSMKAYILKHHRQMIFDALNESIRAGALEMPADVDGGEIVLSAANCTFGPMNFWRYDKYTALAEVIVYPEICTDSGCVPCPLYVELWIDMESGMESWTGACGYLRDMPERRHWRLSDYMIPILRKDEIEEGAEELLRAFCPNAATDRREQDPFVLAKRMGLNVERLPLYGRPHTLSMLFFCPETVMVQEFPATSKDDPPSPYPMTLPGNTILINTRAVHRDFCQLEIYHECIHYDWHFMFYRLQHMHNNDVSALRTRRAVVTDSRGSRNPLRWLEWQANRGSFGLMMPLSMMRDLVREEEASLDGSDLHWGKRYDRIARGIARDHDLPKFRVRARLIQMGHIEAKGALNYVDGAYIEPFAFERSRGNGNYTFVLSRRELFDEYCSNPDFRKRLDSGRYVFADGHVCLNDERYVRAAANGLRLTVWANAHVDRCCLRFVSVYEPCGLSDYRFSCLNSDEEYNRHYIAFAEEDDALSSREKLEHMTRVLDALPDAFPQALSFLMEQTGVTEEALEERSGISVSTISRLRRKERANYSLDQVVALCVALRLPPWLSGELLARAGLMLRRTKQHRAYRLILDCMFMDSLDTVQNFLKASGCEPLKLKAT